MKEFCEIVYQEIDKDTNYENIIKKVINKCFEVEKIENTGLYVSVTLTNAEEIKKINKKHRNIDKATDVLSFPMFERKEIEKIISKKENLNKDILGDIVVSVEQVKKQAKEYNHSFERELSYMIVHGFYHLMGYDHMEEEEKNKMRKKEEAVLEKLNIKREENNEKAIEEAIEEKNEKKNVDERLGNKDFLDSWKNAIKGIIYAVTTQGNVKKQLVIAVIVVILSLLFELSKAEFLIFMFTIILIIFAEMVNTAIETVVDLYTDLYHPKAKIAKDVAAGGVVITALNAVIVAYFLFFDKISDIGLQFIRNVAKSPIHLAFSAIIIAIIGIVTLIAIATTNKHRVLNKKFMPSGHATLAFAANTIIWLTTENIVILTLSLVLSLLVAESRVEAKKHSVKEVVFSSAVGVIVVTIIYGLAFAVLK